MKGLVIISSTSHILENQTATPQKHFVASTKRFSIKDVVAALPIVTCFLVPLIQVAGVIYLYDACILIALWVLGFPRVQIINLNRFELAWRLLIAAVIVGYFSAVVRAGLQIKPTQYTMQFLLGLFFARCFVLNLIAGRIRLEQVARIIATCGLVLACLAIFQFSLFQLAPTLAEDLYKSYLDFSGRSSRYFEGRYLDIAKISRISRVVGTWDVATTFGGMLALSSAWTFFTGWRLKKRLIFVLISMLAVLMTGSRHAWLIQGFILFSLPRISLGTKIVTAAITSIILVLIINILSGALYSQKSDYSSLSDQIGSRFSRSIESGWYDTSVQYRYVEGTRRFVQYALKYPEVLLFGFGTHTENGLEAKLGVINAQRKRFKEDMYGFVSNGWLLILRNWGFLGLMGLVLMHRGPWIIGPPHLKIPLIILMLIIVSDNYAVHVTRCFFQILVFLSAVWAVSLLHIRKTTRRQAPEQENLTTSQIT